MRRCVLLMICVGLGPAALAGPLSLEEAFAVLERRTASWDEFQAASDVAMAECADGDEVCIRRLMNIWSDGWSKQETLMLACRKADDATVEIVLEAVVEMIKVAKEKNEPPGGRLSHRASSFFFKPAILLCERLSDPEPVARFAVENNRPMHHAYALPTEIRDKYTLMWLRGQTGDASEGGSSSKAGALSRAAMGELRTLFRELYRDHPRSCGAWTALETLVDFGDQEIIPDLERIVVDAPSLGKLDYWSEQKARLYLAQLRYRDAESQRVAYLKGAREEREFQRLLRYYVKGLIRLRVPKATIIVALEADQKPNRFGRDITKEGIRLIDPERVVDSPEGKRLRPQGWSLRIDQELLTPDEIREYQRERAEYAAKRNPLVEERNELMRRTQMSPSCSFDKKGFRAALDAKQADFPTEVKRLVEIEEALDALAEDDPAKKWCVPAVIARAP